MKVCEGTLQAVVMRWVMNEKHHQYAIPNSTTFVNYSTETDLVSVTKAGYIHEYEIKISKGDYQRDAKKYKFAYGYLGSGRGSPSYFWYVTYGFEIEPPEKAGWIEVYYDEKRYRWDLRVRKEAPRLNNWKVNEDQAIVAARLLSWKTLKLLGSIYLTGKPEA